MTDPVSPALWRLHVLTDRKTSRRAVPRAASRKRPSRGEPHVLQLREAIEARDAAALPEGAAMRKLHPRRAQVPFIREHFASTSPWRSTRTGSMSASPTARIVVRRVLGPGKILGVSVGNGEGLGRRRWKRITWG